MNSYPAAVGGPHQQYQQHPYAPSQAPQMQTPSYYPQQPSQGQQYGPAMQYPQHQQPAVANVQSCYNCGDPSHWAQACPEPRRAIPAGASQPRPAKRQKPNGPIITRYAPPVTAQPYAQSQPPARKFSNGSGYGQPGYQQQPGQYAPPTPNSAYGQPYPQWPQQSPQQFSPKYPQTPAYGPHGLPTPSTAHGSQFSSPASGHPSAQHQGFFPPQGGSFSGTFPRPTDINSRQNSMTSDRGTGTQIPQSAISSGPSRQQSYNSESFSPTVTSVEPWMEELEGLDIPESSNVGSHINGRQMVWKPANPVAKPLASTFFEAEKMGFLPVAATLKEGASVSKYFNNLDENAQLTNVKESANWKDSEDDPVFMDMTISSEYVPFEDLIQRRNELWGLDRNMDLESEEGELQETENYHGSSDYFQAQPEAHPQVFEEHDHRKEGAHEQDYEPEDEETRAARATEAKLAALGVTGAPKPVHELPPSLNGPITTPANEDTYPSAKQSRSQSPLEPLRKPDSREEREGDNESSIVRNGFDNYVPTHGLPTQNGDAWGQQRRTQSFEKCSGKEGSENRSFQPTPGLLKHNSHGESPQLPKSVDMRQKEQAIKPADLADASNGTSRTQQHNGTHCSPSRRPSDRGDYNARKRSFKRDSSEESNEGPRRQEDDATPKNKRRQPRVAEAYSRRW